MGTRIQIPARVATDRVIAQLTQAERLLQEATTVQQAKVVADVAAAQEVFAHRQRLGDECIGHAHRIKIHALAKLGEFLKAMPKAQGARAGGKKESPRGAFREPRDSATTYADLGLSKKHARDAQQLAALSVRERDAIASREKSLRQVRREEDKMHVTPVDLPPGKFRVLYADPLWHDGSNGVIGDDNSGHTVRHDPSMTTAELCQFDMKSRVADDAVLFLWVTSPLLAACWPVIKAWGFTYQTSFVWDKVDHDNGNYNSVRHELLLVCTRGTCLPDHPTPLPDSVMTVRRSGVHGAKPEEFRQLIDQMFDGGADRKLELFGRQPRGGWTQFGNDWRR